jgi:hypothetical protein
VAGVAFCHRMAVAVVVAVGRIACGTPARPLTFANCKVLASRVAGRLGEVAV